VAAILAAVKKQARTAPEQIAAHLRWDESLRAVFHVIVPVPTAGTAWDPAAIVVPLVMIVRKVMWNRAAAVAQEAVGIGLRPRMLWALTDQRILLFGADKRWELGEQLGAIAMSEVLGATAPTVGQSWRTVIIELTGGRRLSIKVGHKIADDLAAALTAAARTGSDGDG
jgi:hypothetical protein